MADIRTTTGKPITTTTREQVLVFDAEGNPHACSPVDAKECVATGRYFWQLSDCTSNEQQSKQQSIVDDSSIQEAQSVKAATGENVVEEALNAITKRRKKV